MGQWVLISEGLYEPDGERHDNAPHHYRLDTIEGDLQANDGSYHCQAASMTVAGDVRFHSQGSSSCRRVTG